MNLIKRMFSGERTALSRLISQIENRDPNLSEIMREIYPKTGGARVIGITGPPGAGKSTLVDSLTHLLRKQKKRVAVVAVDPSSPFSGGAILGDRIRMQAHSSDDGVYIRSLGTRGRHGGLSLATKEVVHLLDAAGFDYVLVETAGVGQTELEVLRLAQSIVVVLVPESGDSIQVMKAGLMEIADVFAVNKSDRPQADQMVRDLVTMVALGAQRNHDLHPNDPIETYWKQPVQKTQATNHTGVSELLDYVLEHQSYLESSGAKKKKELEFIRREVAELLNERLSHSIDEAFESEKGQKMLDDILSRKSNPHESAQEFYRLISNK